MNEFKVGDIITGTPESDKTYTKTNSEMLKGLVVSTIGEEIEVKILEHKEAFNVGLRYTVSAEFFKKIGELKPFNKSDVLALIATGKKEQLAEYNLSGADLGDADLRRAYLSDADLSGADLRRADLGDADLSGADLRRANLSDANLSDANLSGADLRRADLRRADLGDANLSDANLSGADGLLSAINYMEAHFERTNEGYIVYKTFGSQYRPNPNWKIKKGSIIEETVNHTRTQECGCGINVAPLEWVKQNCVGDIYELLIKFEWLSEVCVPYNTDGKIRCGRVEIIEKVKK